MKYIIRLDDACENMNANNWNRVCEILYSNNIKPIVGVIPHNEDNDFQWGEDTLFWEKVNKWQSSGWCIAIHGLNHRMREFKNTRLYYQKSHDQYTEFAGLPFEEQARMLKNGYKMFFEHSIQPKCFFAPAHTYDLNTVHAIREVFGDKIFISDGYAFHPYKKDDVVFLPSFCDGPFSLPFGFKGVVTYVFHPSTMSEEAILRLENFVKKEKHNIISVDGLALNKCVKLQGFIGKSLENVMFWIRGLRKAVKDR